METIFKFENKWDYKNIGFFAFLLILPNFLGMINIPLYGFKIHFFQIGIFLAASFYGPMGGMMSGITGSFYSAMIMNNPYIVAGNMILGFFTGLFMRYGYKAVYAAMLAFLIQIPWLVLTDYYLVNMPLMMIFNLVIALTVSNLIWSATAGYIHAKT